MGKQSTTLGTILFLDINLGTTINVALEDQTSRTSHLTSRLISPLNGAKGTH